MTLSPRVLVVHNYYQQRGGEDGVVEAEVRLLQERGHAVELYTRHNDELAGVSAWRAAVDSVWSRRTSRELTELVEQFRPDVIHVHNSFPLISPSLYWASGGAAVPIVQTLHNFRLLCAQAMLLRNGMICEDCVGRLPWRGVVRKCYRNSISQSAVLVGMLGTHRVLGTYRDKVTRYIALNEFCRDKFIEGGLPPERIVVKPNFVSIPHASERARSGGLFVGRLSEEKGVAVLCRALRALPTIGIDVIGIGPAETEMKECDGVHLMGWQDPEAVYQVMRRKAYLILPSISYENFPRTLVEAFACGLPVIASRLGAMAELIEDGRTGMLFDARSPQDLAEKIAWAEQNPAALREMGVAARKEYEAKYTPDRNYEQLIDIYRDAIEAEKGKAHVA